MTYQNAKKKLVDDDKVVSVKSLNRFSIKLALFIFGVALSLSMGVLYIVGTGFAVAVLLLAIFAYVTVFDMIAENTKVFKSVNKVTNFWWLGYFGIVVVFFVLKYLHFA